METGFINKETNQITIIEGDKTPRNRFPPSKFEKIFEIASVQVIKIYILIIFYFLTYSIFFNYLRLPIGTPKCFFFFRQLSERNALTEIN